MSESNEQLASEISQRISQLETLIGEDLKNEMDALKKAILENPSASALLKDEDVGMLVSSLRRIVGIAIASQAAKEKKPKAEKDPVVKKKLSQAELADALNSDEW